MQKLTQISHSNNSYISDLSNVFGFSEIFSYSYNESCDRVPFYKNGEITPFRVAKINKAKIPSKIQTKEKLTKIIRKTESKTIKPIIFLTN